MTGQLVLLNNSFPPTILLSCNYNNIIKQYYDLMIHTGNFCCYILYNMIVYVIV